MKGEEFAVWARGREVCVFIVEGQGSDRVWVRGEGMFLRVEFIEEVYHEQENEYLTPSMAESLKDVGEGKYHCSLDYHGSVGENGDKGVTERRRTGGVDCSYVVMSNRELSLVCFRGRKLAAWVHSSKAEMQGCDALHEDRANLKNIEQLECKCIRSDKEYSLHFLSFNFSAKSKILQPDISSNAIFPVGIRRGLGECLVA